MIVFYKNEQIFFPKLFLIKCNGVSITNFQIQHQIKSFNTKNKNRKPNIFPYCLSQWSSLTLFLELRFSASMATVQLESFSIIRSSKLPPSIVASSRPITAKLPNYTALKLRSLSATPFRTQSSSRVFPRRGSVVCEAREDTAVEG
jgi:hypothetical protein